MNSTRRAFATAAVLAAVLAPQAAAQGVDLRSPDARDGAAAQVDLRSPDASAPFTHAEKAPAPRGSSSDPNWVVRSIAGLALAAGLAVVATRRRRRLAVPVRG
jgi:hypothetical protein